MSVDPADGAGDGSENAITDTGGARWHGATENGHPDHDNHRHAINADDSLVVDAGTDGTKDALDGQAGEHVWTSGWDELEGTGDTDFEIHKGAANGGEDTDNRPRFYAFAAIQRFE